MSTSADLMVAKAAIERMLRAGRIDICTIRDCIELLRVIPDDECFNRLKALHCVRISEMERDLQLHIPAWINGALGGPRLTADSIPALGGSAASAPEPVALIDADLGKGSAA